MGSALVRASSCTGPPHTYTDPRETRHVPTLPGGRDRIAAGAAEFLAARGLRPCRLPCGARAFAKDNKGYRSRRTCRHPDAALDQLMKGNARYVEGVSRRHDFKHEREPLAQGQNPFAAVLSCADSRIAPEFCFDTARGDVFVCRHAGNFADEETIASFEYGVAVLNVPLLMVLGHDACG